jgi:hypothetical protein
MTDSERVASWPSGEIKIRFKETFEHAASMESTRTHRIGSKLNKQRMIEESSIFNVIY